MLLVVYFLSIETSIQSLIQVLGWIHDLTIFCSQTELTRKMGTDSFIESRMTASGVELGLGGGGIEQKGKRTHGRGQRCGDCWGKEYKGTEW